jgi:hypothetical protein
VIKKTIIKPDFICNTNYFTSQPQTPGKRDIVMVQQRRFWRHPRETAGTAGAAIGSGTTEAFSSGNPEPESTCIPGAGPGIMAW